MNPLVPWLPGTVLILVAVLLVTVGQIRLWPAFVIIGLGVSLESAGALLWLRQRNRNDSR